MTAQNDLEELIDSDSSAMDKDDSDSSYIAISDSSDEETLVSESSTSSKWNGRQETSVGKQFGNQPPFSSTIRVSSLQTSSHTNSVLKNDGIANQLRHTPPGIPHKRSIF